jgi:hypothetical protein
MASEYLHHMLGEENSHMWFFAEVCSRYCGGLVADSRLLINSDIWPTDAVDILCFLRIYLFEDMVDIVNRLNAECDELPPLLHEINKVHHEDESRHIAFGKTVVAALSSEFGDERPAWWSKLSTYCDSYIDYIEKSLYNPRSLREAKIHGGRTLLAEALGTSAGLQRREVLFGRARSFLDVVGLASPATA